LDRIQLKLSKQRNRIEAQIHPQNKPSIKLIERLGFKNEGLMREAGFSFGQYHDLFMFSLLQSDVKQNRPRSFVN